MDMHEVTFEPDGIKVKVPANMSLLEAAGRAGIIIASVCGGAGTCKKCQVDISLPAGASTERAGPADQPAGPDGKLPDNTLDNNVLRVLACQYRVDRDLVVTVPDSARFFEQKILEEAVAAEAHLEPTICKHYLELSKPSLSDLRSDARRLVDAVQCHTNGLSHTCRDHAATAPAGTTITWGLLQCLPRLFRDNNYAVTAVCHGGRVFALEPGDTTGTLYGLAVDVGTTTVVASLINLLNGKTVAVASETNPQVTCGDDIISRIEYSRAQTDGLKHLQHRIIECINRLIAQLCRQTLVNPWQIYEMTAAGNATMQHLLVGIPVEQIAQAPYVSAVSSALNIPAGALGLDIHPEGNVYVLAGIAAHIGGDTVAVALSSAMEHSEQINLALDIGTNGEVILGNSQRLLACSTAAGPAFEGGRIRKGMRAAAGAIEQVFINEDVQISVIGDAKPMGICGSGLIDAIAELLNVGILDSSGRLLENDELPHTVPAKVRQRLVSDNDKSKGFMLVGAEDTKHGEPIVLTQRDIREAQLGKAAISAGVQMLLKTLGVKKDQISRVYIAGAFGNYIRPQSARRVGLLPDVPLENIQFIGNAASAGAKQALLSVTARRHAEQLAERIE